MRCRSVAQEQASVYDGPMKYAATHAMGALLFFLKPLVHDWFAGGSLIERIVETVILLAAGVVSYAVLALGLRAASLAEIKAGLGKK